VLVAEVAHLQAPAVGGLLNWKLIARLPIWTNDTGEYTTRLHPRVFDGLLRGDAAVVADGRLFGIVAPLRSARI
jgi:hypothetical protein